MPAGFGFRRASEWATGFVGYIALRPDAALNGWTLAFDADFTITSIWGAEIIDTAPGRFLVRSLSWTAQVAAGGTVEFGFTATTTTPGESPSAFLLGPPTVLELLPPPPPPPPTPPSVAIAALDGAEGSRDVVFVLTLSEASATPVTLRFATADGTARAGLDYAALAGSITFAAGETRKEILVRTLNDAVLEGTERFSLTLLEATGATLPATASVSAAIIDDEAPRISIADASALEGAANLVALRFTVTLSHAVGSTVVVRFATADGTALAGPDYVARSGSVTFLPGETSKGFTVTLLGDRAIEADETFVVRLSDPVRGTIADGEAIATIRNDDRPGIAIADAAAVTEGDPGASRPVGVLSTQGNQIVDEAGTPVRIAAVNWFGMETTRFAPDGLHARNWREMMDQMVELGFNAIRLPFSAQAVQEGGTPTSINYALNPDLAGLSPLQIMDRIVDYAGDIGLRILLDHHRSAAGDGPNGNGLWYDGRFTEARWIDMWEDLAARYRGDPTVIGADLSNEPHAATWAQWASAAERAGNAVLAANPDWLVVVEGVAAHQGEYYWWGGNLMGARDRPVVLSAPDKLVYSPHDYPNSVYAQPFFYAPDFPANLPALFDKMWGYLWREGTAPVLIGELGSRLEDPKDLAWLDAIVSYMSGDLNNDGTQDRADLGPSFAWWSWNPNSGDTGGILANDWRTPITAKLAALEPVLSDAVAPARAAEFAVTLTEAALSAVTLGWRTLAGTASDADYVAASGTLTFAPGETRKTIEVLLRPDEIAEAQESFRVELFDIQGATVVDRIGIGRITDDDWVL
jgi:chitinase